RAAISVIECQGKTKIPLFAKILSALKIPFVVVHDEDIQDINAEWSEKRQDEVRKKNSDHRKWNQQIADAVGDPSRVLILAPTFEDICSLPHREDTKLQQALELFSGVTADGLPAKIKQAAERLLA